MSQTPKRLHSRLEITPLGGVSLLLFHLSTGAGLLAGDQTAQLAASLLFAPIFVDVLDKFRNRPRYEIAAGPRRIEARRPFHDTVRLRSLGNTLRGLRIRPDDGAGAAGTQLVDRVAAHEETDVAVRCRGTRRGIYRERRFRVYSAYPLGLWNWRIDSRVDAPLIVEPAREVLPQSLRRALEGARARPLVLAPAGEPEFHALRELRAGEDARRVHARRSAALGYPVTRVDRPLGDLQWTVILDLRRPPGAPEGWAKRPFEIQLGRAAKLLDESLTHGIELQFLVIGEDVSEHRVADQASARDVLTLLAGAQTVPHHSVDALDEHLRKIRDQLVWISAAGCQDSVVRRATESTDALVVTS